MANINAHLLPKPDKFNNQCDVSLWLQQFELFTSLSKIRDDNKAHLLLTFLDITIYETVVNALPVDKRLYDDIILFLKSRFSTRDVYLDRQKLFSSQYTTPPEIYAAELNRILDSYDTDKIREQILLSKFVSAAPRDIATQLRLRRPNTLNECVQVWHHQFLLTDILHVRHLLQLLVQIHTDLQITAYNIVTDLL